MPVLLTLEEMLVRAFVVAVVPVLPVLLVVLFVVMLVPDVKPLYPVKERRPSFFLSK